ncbi:tyrosine--tRNA ligase [Prosthecochloris sp. GSB1]|uniref:tyrosine--tRNA ligase n=1 Tax=Prosthecochloris sp. GSB1 TaxID=281093 RepID=UPI000B8CA5D3|nr:tyrosine--tRNA ligase [Prosthecochloris sp. GSB1]ASQ90932.1 tyrosine--tRNA ligase [Prosthecochloris sp. GSB1]
MNNTEKEALIDKILKRGIIKTILPSEDEFRKRLLADKPLKFYIGADPTADSLHLSHAKNFMLLEDFRKLGHKVFVLFGDLTACIGDPSDRDSVRDQLSREKAKENAQSWVNQIKAIIDFEDESNPAQVVYNSSWFDAFNVTELLSLFSNATVQQMLERDMFEKRLKEDKPIFLHEFLYPMFQGYDSVALDIDVELCGTDQIFNALTGRSLLKKYKDKEKFVVAVNLMENPKTGTLMSKSNGTGVFLGGGAQSMFGQIMAQPDEMIEVILVNNTRISLDSIASLDILNSPRDAKLFTAVEVTSLFYGKDEAEKQKQHFIETFSKQKFPMDAPVIQIADNQLMLIDLLMNCVPDKSKSELRRLVTANAVSIDGVKHTDPFESLVINSEMELKVGNRLFFRIRK